MGSDLEIIRAKKARELQEKYHQKKVEEEIKALRVDEVDIFSAIRKSAEQEGKNSIEFRMMGHPLSKHAVDFLNGLGYQVYIQHASPEEMFLTHTDLFIVQVYW